MRNGTKGIQGGLTAGPSAYPPHLQIGCHSERVPHITTLARVQSGIVPSKRVFQWERGALWMRYDVGAMERLATTKLIQP